MRKERLAGQSSEIEVILNVVLGFLRYSDKLFAFACFLSFSVVCLFVISLGRSFVCLFIRSFVCLFDFDFDVDFVRVCLFASLVCLFANGCLLACLY